MKNFTLIVALFFMGWTTYATTTNNILRPNYGEAFIFIEGGVEFAVYPDGEFDFHYNPRFVNNSVVNISNPGYNVSYNAGYNYDAFVQFDDYGAVIQIENVPVFYDYYGRIIQAGNVMIDYNNRGHIVRVGNLQVRYNSFNQPVRYIGFINQYNTRYVYRPWHRYYVRPHLSHRVVYYEPYRAFYQPVRMNYVQYTNVYQTNNHYYNKSNFYRPGQQVASYNYGRRTTTEREVTPAVRSNQNVSRDYADNSKNTKTAVRSNTTSGRNSTGNTYSENVARERSNVERHEAAVRAQRGITSSSANVSSRGTNEVKQEAAVRTQRSSTPVQTRATETRRSSNATSSKPATVSRSTSTRVQNNATRSNVRERSTNVRSTQNDTNRSSVRSQGTTPRSSAVKPATRKASSGSTRSSGIRG